MSSIPWDDLFASADEATTNPVPASDYNVKIVKTEAVTSSTNKPMWKIVAEIEDGPYAGRKIYTQQVLSIGNDNAVAIFFRVMAALGLNRDYFKTKPSNQAIADAMLNRRAKAKIIVKPYNGEDRNEVAKWSPLTAGGLQPPAGVGTPPSTPPPAAPPAPIASPAAAAQATSAPPVAPPAAPPATPTTQEAPAAPPAAPAPEAVPAPAEVSAPPEQAPAAGTPASAPAAPPPAPAPEQAPQAAAQAPAAPPAPPAAPAPAAPAAGAEASGVPTQSAPF